MLNDHPCVWVIPKNCRVLEKYMISCYVLISWHPKSLIVQVKTWRKLKLYWLTIKLGCFCICEMQNDHFYEVGSSYDEFYDMDKLKICFHFKDTNSLFWLRWSALFRHLFKYWVDVAIATDHISLFLQPSPTRNRRV